MALMAKYHYVLKMNENHILTFFLVSTFTDLDTFFFTGT